MYESFFGLQKLPFSSTPHPDCCAALPPMCDAFEELFPALNEQQGVSVLTAPPGLGKTLLCQKLAEQLEPSAKIALIQNARFATRRALLQAILYEWNQPYSRMSEQELRLNVTSVVQEAFHKNQRVVILLDEAHFLGAHVLQEIHTLVNLSNNDVQSVNCLLSGQLSLEETLISPGLSSLNQRIIAHISLSPLTRSESADYIDYRIRQAGGNLEKLFSGDALETICKASDGVPRCLNQLCDHSLRLAFKRQQSPVSDDIAREALEEVKQLPLQWNDPGPIKSPIEQIREQSQLEPDASERSVTKTSETARPETEHVTDHDTSTTVFEVGSEEGNEQVFSARTDLEVVHQNRDSTDLQTSSADSEAIEFGFDHQENESENIAEIRGDIAETSSNDKDELDVVEIGDCSSMTLEESEENSSEFVTDNANLNPEIQTTQSSAQAETASSMWERVDLIALPQNSATGTPPAILTATGNSLLDLEWMNEIESAVNRVTSISPQFHVEKVNDHYADLERTQVASNHSLLTASLPSDVNRNPLESQSLLASMGLSFSHEFLDTNCPTTHVPNCCTESIPQSTFLANRPVVMMQEIVGMNMMTGDEHSVLVPDGDPQNHDLQTHCLQWEIDSEQFDIPPVHKPHQISSSNRAIDELDCPSQLASEPGQHPIQQKDMPPRMTEDDAETLEALKFGDILRSPFWSNLETSLDDEVTEYDVVEPELDPSPANSSVSPQRGSMFNDLKRRAANA
ncbi:MAG: hypothetical protein Tsb009_04880 [Planctomycetaceae bacterium]